jgi:hypothetical protein
MITSFAWGEVCDQCSSALIQSCSARAPSFSMIACAIANI